MKYFYPEHNYLVKTVAKRAGVNLGTFCECYARIPSSDDYFQLFTQHLFTREKDAIDYGTNHVFVVGDEFADWLISTGGDLDEAACVAASSAMLPSFLTPANEQSCIIKTRSKDAFVLFVTDLPNKEGLLCYCSQLEKVMVFAPKFRQDPKFQQVNDCLCSHNQSFEYPIKLLCGLVKYLSVFPSSIRPGLPADAKHPSHYKGKMTHSITWNAGLTRHASPCGHFRCAHKRKLDSKMFVHKRGLVIDVKACWVGPDKTYVISDERFTGC